MTLYEFINKALCCKYVDGGRDYDGIDCYGIPFLAYRDVLGIDLPAFYGEYEDGGKSVESRATINDLILANKNEWELVDKYEPMDVVLFTLGGNPIHVGIMIDSKRFLHCERKIGVVVEKISSFMWWKRLEGVYRLRK